jgi:transcriptional regulator with XRE-family HTH domain
MRGDSQVFAQRLMRLFRESKRPDGRRWTLEGVAEACGERGEPTSPQHLAQLRAGERTNPRLPLIEALADIFGVPVTYFFSDNLGHLTADLLPLLLAMVDPGVRAALTDPELPATLKLLSDPAVRAELAALAQADPTKPQQGRRR